MGLLDPKTRIMDTFLTEEGRRQLAGGKLQISYAAFSDGATFYELDAVSGSSDATCRIYSEATNLPQDQITMKADDSGKLRPFPNPSGINVIGGRIVSGSLLVPTEGQQFASMAEKLLASSIDNFANLRLISTIDDIFGDELFELNAESVEFTLTDTLPMPASRIDNVSIQNIPTFLEDPRMSHALNYKFLPPVIRTNSEEATVRLSHTVPLGPQFNDETVFIDAYKQHLSDISVVGGHQRVVMDPTSHDGNVMMQFFESQTDGTLVKLDVLAFESKRRPGDAVYFVGKIVTDRSDFKFVNIFTMTVS